MNSHKTEGIAGLLAQFGYELCDDINGADVVIFNTCAVREKAEQKVYGKLGELLQRKRKSRFLLGVGGCMAQVQKEKLLRRYPEIDFLFGTTDINKLPLLISRCNGQAADKKDRVSISQPCRIEDLPYRRRSNFQAMVTITEGCSHFCSFCIVPYAKGLMRSRSPKEIIDEVTEITTQGYKEVLLLGQNVDAYGRDNPEYGDFAGLLSQVSKVPIPRIRFISSHPRDMTISVLEEMASAANICEHLHLPCQSGSDRILTAMNRMYTRAQFLALITNAREIIPRLNITTDLIVGYPTESEDDFSLTLSLLEEARFGSVFVAKYSPRPGTMSANLPDDVPTEVKEERLQKVLRRQRQIAREEKEKLLAQEAAVLVEGMNRQEGTLFGRMRDYRTVLFPGDESLIGEIITVVIEESSTGSLKGRTLQPLKTPERRGKKGSRCEERGSR